MTPEEMEAKSTALQEEINGLSDDFGAKLVEFLNSQDMTVGSELTDVQKQAFGFKIEEDILVAQRSHRARWRLSAGAGHLQSAQTARLRA